MSIPAVPVPSPAPAPAVLADARASSSSNAAPARLVRAGPWVASAWAAVALLGAPDLTALELLQAGLLLALGMAAWWRSGHFEGLAASSLGRMETVAFFLLAAWLGLPAFQTVGAMGAAGAASFFDPSKLWFHARMAGALAAALGLVWLDRAERTAWPAASSVSPSTSPRTSPNASPEARLEAFFLYAPGRSRAGLTGLAFLAGGLCVALRGANFTAALWSGALLGASAGAWRPLLRLCAKPEGAKRLGRPAFVLLALFLSGGAVRLALSNRSLDTARKERNGKALAAAEAYNRTLHWSRLAAWAEALRARWAEEAGRWKEARRRWAAVARLRGAAPERFAPVLRLACRLGDAEPLWRELLRRGFPALRDPGLASGRALLAQAPRADLRARLLAAFWAWDAQAPEAERRASLEAVQTLLPNELSSRVLLSRLGKGEPLPEGLELTLPAELFFPNPPPKKKSGAGLSPFDAREASTLVVLDAGRWKAALEAAGTPLLGEAPVLRVELDGRIQEVLQVLRPDPRRYEFTLDVERSDIHRLKLVFANGARLFEHGRFVRRWMSVKRLTFIKAKRP